MIQKKGTANHNQKSPKNKRKCEKDFSLTQILAFVALNFIQGQMFENCFLMTYYLKLRHNRLCKNFNLGKIHIFFYFFIYFYCWITFSSFAFILRILFRYCT